MMVDSGLLASFLGALQACVSVLLTMCYGIAARRMHLIHDAAINDMSGLSVKLFLPALIIVNLGQQLHLGTVMNYIPVIVWSITYTTISIGMAHVLSKLLKLPQWVTPACAFNNTTSLPLLLLDSLDSVGSLRLILRKGETTSDEIDRAQSYFLVCAAISKTIAYVVGPKMLHDKGISTPYTYIDSGPGTDSESEPGPFLEEAFGNNSHPDEPQELPTETTSLLARNTRPFTSRLSKYKTKLVAFFPHRMKQNLMAAFGSPFADVAICCTFLGAMLGLVPTLHRAFFARDEDGGIFNAWLTTSIRNIGRLFTTLQIFMVGCKLGVTLERMVAESRDRRMGRLEGERDSASRISFKAIVVVFLFRLVVWPAVSIPVVYGFARAKILGDDPMLWFSMMLIPAGPPALIILGLAELAKASEGEKMAIAKSLTIMYALSPVVCFTITGALKAVEAVLDEQS